MSNQDDIRSRFLSYEPEVSNEAIEKSWEKIKYFLPQKESRRGIFIWFNKKGRGILSLLLVLLSAGFFFTLFQPDKGVKELVSEKAPGNKSISKHPSAAEKNKGPEQGEHNAEAIPSSHKPLKNEPGKEIPPHKIKNAAQNSDKDAAENNVQEPAGSLTEPALKQDEQTALQAPGTDSTPVQAERGTIYLAYDLNRSRDDSLMQLKREYGLWYPKKLVSVTMMAGMQNAFMKVVQGPQTSPENRANIMAGAVLDYQIRDRISLEAAVVLSRNRMDYGRQITGNKILSGYIFQSTGPTVFRDTIRYLNAEMNTRITASSAYYAAAGLSYHLLAKKRVLLNASALFSVRSVNYRYTVNNFVHRDTLEYLRGGPGSPFTNVLPTTFKEESYSGQSRVLSYGITPGITVGYRITNRMDLVLRTAYFIELSENALIFKADRYNIRQNALLSGLGLAIRL